MGPMRRKLRLNGLRRVGPCSDRTGVLKSCSFPPCLFLSLPPSPSLHLSLCTFSEGWCPQDRAAILKARQESSHQSRTILDLWP